MPGRSIKEPCRQLLAWPALSEKHIRSVGGNSCLLTFHPCGSLGKTEASPRAASHPCSLLAVSSEESQACAKGCELCSEVNGCLKCSPKLFILLERNDIRQVGVCLPSCPPGYFDARNPDMNKCISECGQGWGRVLETLDMGRKCLELLMGCKRSGGDIEEGSSRPDISPDIPPTFPARNVAASPPSKPALTCVPTGDSQCPNPSPQAQT